MIKLYQGNWKKGNKLRNKKTNKIVRFDTYYVDGLFKYTNENQSNIIGWIKRFEEANIKDTK